MKKILILSIIFITIIIAIKVIYVRSTPKAILTQIRIGGTTLQVELAQTPAQITLGLGQRDTLGSDGMLFTMPSRGVPTFWMKDMRFDLDFVWIDGNSVVDITENVPSQRGASENELNLYRPRQVVTHVLEMNSGEVRKRGIHIGDSVTF